MDKELEEILTSHRGKPGILVMVLQEAQAIYGFLPEKVISEIADFLGMSPAAVYGVASFYPQFRFERQGKHTVRVCQGTACHIKGGRRVLEAVVRELGIGPGETTPDFMFTMERIACFGSCALAPVMVVDRAFYGRMTTVKVKKILDLYRSGTLT
jgi:NADH:ubiquinone oxidoreductase subunit E